MKEKERLKNTFFCVRIEQESDQNERFQKEETKIENEKKKKMEKQKKRKTLGKSSFMIYFSRMKWSQKKRKYRT